jgi:hypothetical protein
MRAAGLSRQRFEILLRQMLGDSRGRLTIWSWIDVRVYTVSRVGSRSPLRNESQ